MINAQTQICMIIGDPARHSLSPLMHNAAYAKLGIADRYVFTAADVPLMNLAQAVSAVRTLKIRGLTCTMPHKLEVLQHLDEVDQIARQIGAVNTVVNQNGILKGFNTDWLGVLVPLQQKVSDLAGKRAAVLGAGGAARAVVYALKSAGMAVHVFNRTLAKAEELAAEFDCQSAGELSAAEAIAECDIIINATSVGFGGDESPIAAKIISAKHIVFESIYKPHKTAMILAAESAGAACIYGYEMLLHQGTAQFELYTGAKAPVDTMRQILIDNLQN